METIIVLFGMCLTFTPIVIFVWYLLTSMRSKKAFAYHLEKVKDKKNNLGVIIAYIDKILLGILIVFLGLYFSSFFSNTICLELFIACLILYIIIHFFDEKNEE